MRIKQSRFTELYLALYCMKKNFNVAVGGHAIMLILSAWPNVFKIIVDAYIKNI